MLAAALEAAVIGWLQPTEWELAWISGSNAAVHPLGLLAGAVYEEALLRLAGRGPSDQLNWDDDRSVVVVAVRDAEVDERQLIERSSQDHVRAVKWSEVI